MMEFVDAGEGARIKVVGVGGGGGNAVNTMPAKASAAKSTATGRPRCGISSLPPVAISSPAATAETPSRML